MILARLDGRRRRYDGDVDSCYEDSDDYDGDESQKDGNAICRNGFVSGCAPETQIRHILDSGVVEPGRVRLLPDPVSRYMYHSEACRRKRNNERGFLLHDTPIKIEDSLDS